MGTSAWELALVRLETTKLDDRLVCTHRNYYLAYQNNRSRLTVEVCGHVKAWLQLVTVCFRLCLCTETCAINNRRLSWWRLHVCGVELVS